MAKKLTAISILRIEIEDSEAVGISSIISNLITVFPRNILTAIPNELFSSFVNCLAHLTCSFGRSAALEEVVSIYSQIAGSLFFFLLLFLFVISISNMRIWLFY